MGIPNIDLNNINFDNTHYDEFDSDTIIHIRILVFTLNFKNAKHNKKN